MKTFFLFRVWKLFRYQILNQRLGEMGFLIIIVSSFCNHHFGAPEITEISTFLLVLPKYGKICQFSMVISNSTFNSQKNNISNPCVTLNSIHELSSKKKKQLKINHIWEISHKIRVKIRKKANNTKKACKLEYTPKT